jgi:hypothetical protein
MPLANDLRGRETVALPSFEPAGNLGFLTIHHDSNGYIGGYLVTNQWGRPLEFRLSSAVQPNRLQQILYGDTLEPYICGDLIGKTLVDKTSVAAGCILTDRPVLLELRRNLEIPVACIPQALSMQPPLTHPGFPEDSSHIHNLIERQRGILDLAEPFVRIRDAMSEARKTGATNRA